MKREELEGLLDAQGTRLLRFAALCLLDETGAEPALQEAVTELAAADCSDGQAACALVACLFRVCCDRAHPRREAGLSASGAAAAWLTALRRMPPRQRGLVLLYGYLQLSEEEMAAVLALPAWRVRVRLRHVLRRLDRSLSHSAV